MNNMQNQVHWSHEASIYHVFPLGLCGNRGIRSLIEWIEPARNMGCNTLLLGPIWDSSSHGYDTKDYFRLDPRLGSEEDLVAVLQAWIAAVVAGIDAQD